MFKRQKGTCEHADPTPHPEKQSRNTRVSEYLRKYGQGKIDDLPRDSRPEIVDERSVDQMLEEGDELGLGVDELDVISKLNEFTDRLNQIESEIKLAKEDKVAFDNAVSVLNDPNSSMDARRDAYRVLKKLEKQGKVTFD